MKELKRRIRLKRYGDGKDDEYYYQTQNTETGDVYNVHPSALGAKNLEVTLPEVQITAPRKYEYRSAFNGNQEYLGDLVSFAPVIGDAYDAYNAVRQAANGNYADAGIMAAGALLPGAADKLLKKASPLVRDIVSHPLDVVKAKLAGEYAFTKRGRQKLVDNWTEHLQPIAADVQYYADQLERSQRQMRFAGHGYKSPDVITDAPTRTVQYKYTPESVGKYNAINTADIVLDKNGARLGNDLIEIPAFEENSYFLRKSLDPTRGLYDKNKELYYLLGHEYTHTLQRDRFFSPWLTLNEPYVPGTRMTPPNKRGYSKSNFSNLPENSENPFSAIARRNDILNNREAEADALGLFDIDLSDTHGATPWNSAANEAVADLRGMRLAGYSTDDIYRHMNKIFGMSADDVDLAIRMGYNKGKDSGIHINPKNRGKFNALKKRTGKTTEQLTHSKNPLTRKRAIFAQNSRKWHHK